MKRRDFIARFGSVATAPLAAQAQQAAIPIVGLLSSRSPEESTQFVAAFHQGLSEVGYVDGRDVLIESRWAEGDYDRLPALARELVDRHVAVIVAVGSTPTVLAAKGTAPTTPIVFVGGDPVRLGLVSSFNRPGGNITGLNLISAELGAKRLELLCQMVPKARTIALLLNPSNQEADVQRKIVQVAADALNRRIVVAQAASEAEFEPAIATLVQQQADGMIVANDPFFDSQRVRLIGLAARRAIPAIYHIREWPVAGGLMSYGASLIDAYRQVGVYAGRILRGTNPSELPVMQPTKFELVINTKTAKTLGIEVPPELLARADEVIE